MIYILILGGSDENGEKDDIIHTNDNVIQSWHGFNMYITNCAYYTLTLIVVYNVGCHIKTSVIINT